MIGSGAAFEKQQEAKGYERNYAPLSGLEDVPYVCLRLPTGGGKTLLGSYVVKLAAENFWEREYPFVLWLVPTDTIRQQTLKTLNDVRHPNREALTAAFGNNVRVYDITEFTRLRPQDVMGAVNIFVATFAALSFWLPTHTDNFYPDFVAKLKNGLICVIEYKGAHLASNDDTKEKDMLGRLWADKSGGQCRFLMATAKDEQGRDLAAQVREILN